MTVTLEDRVTSLEVRMDEQERLRASQDRDLSDIAERLRGQDRLLRALAETQSEHTRTLAGHTQILAEHTQALAKLSDEVKRGFSRIAGMLDTLIERS